MALSKRKPRMAGRKSVRLDSEVEVLDLSKYDKQWLQMRTIGPMTSCGILWVDLGEGENGKNIRFPKIIPGYNPETEEFSSKDPLVKFAEAYPDNARISQLYMQNVIIREIQEEGPTKLGKKRSESEKKRRKFPEWTEDPNKYFIKDKESKSWTPCLVFTPGPSVVSKLQNLKGANKVKIKGETKFFDVDDVKHGADIQIMYDSSKKGTDKYQVMIADKNIALTEEEMDYLLWDINPEHLESCKAESIDELKGEVRRWTKRIDGDEAEDDEDEDEDDSSRKRKKKRNDYLEDEDDDEDDEVPKKKSRKRDEDEDADDDDDDDDDDDLDDLEDDEEDEDEDEKPKKKSKSSRNYDDEEDEDEKPKKKKKKSKRDEDDEDEDEEDEKPKKKKKKSRK